LAGGGIGTGASAFSSSTGSTTSSSWGWVSWSPASVGVGSGSGCCAFCSPVRRGSLTCIFSWVADTSETRDHERAGEPETAATCPCNIVSCNLGSRSKFPVACPQARCASESKAGACRVSMTDDCWQGHNRTSQGIPPQRARDQFVFVVFCT